MKLLKVLYVVALFLFLIQQSHATIIRVDCHGGGDFTSIQEAINSASNGDTVLVDTCVYYENIDFYGKNILVASNYIFDGFQTTVEATVIDGGGTGRVVKMQSVNGADVGITGFTITNGHADVGGGIYCYLSDSTRINNNMIIGNTADCYGGGIYVGRSSPIIQFNYILYNDAENGGGVKYSDSSSGYLLDNIIRRNYADNGGGIHIYGGSSPTIRDNTIDSNTVHYFGGGIECSGGSSSHIANNYILGNEVTSGGGGGISCDGCTAMIDSNRVVENETGSCGGGILLISSNATVVFNTVVKNSSSGHGGGVEFYLDSSDFSNNTVDENSASEWMAGGGVDCMEYSAPKIVNNIITRSLDGCGISCSQNSNPEISFNDVWDNYDGNFCGCPSGVGDTDWGTNWNDTPCDSFYNIIQNPMFADAANGDFYLQEDSPCIDAGDSISCPDFKSGCRIDMGAYEFDQEYICGDANGDGEVTIADVIYLFNYLIKGGPPPEPLKAGDVNCDHDVTMADVVCLINYLFNGGPPPCCPYSQSNGLAKVSTSDIDTPAWANKIAMVGSSQEVALNLSNNQELGAVVLALKFAEPGSDVTLTSFSFEGTKVEYIDFKEILVNNDEKTVLIYAIPFKEDYIAAGEGSIAKLRFEGKDPITLEATKISRQDGISLIGSDADELEFEFNSTPVAKPQKKLPATFSLSQNHPNPFNPHTIIDYALSQDAKVSLVIYNVLGQKVKTLVDEYQTAGFQSVEWDGTDDNGNVTSSGIYFYKLGAGEYTETKKMLMLK